MSAPFATWPMATTNRTMDALVTIGGFFPPKSIAAHARAASASYCYGLSTLARQGTAWTNLPSGSELADALAIEDASEVYWRMASWGSERLGEWASAEIMERAAVSGMGAWHGHAFAIRAAAQELAELCGDPARRLMSFAALGRLSAALSACGPFLFFLSPMPEAGGHAHPVLLVADPRTRDAHDMEIQALSDSSEERGA